MICKACSEILHKNLPFLSENKENKVFSKGPFTCVDSYLFVQSVLRVFVSRPA